MVMMLMVPWWWSRFMMPIMPSPIVACMARTRSMAYAMRRCSMRARRIVMIAAQFNLLRRDKIWSGCRSGWW